MRAAIYYGARDIRIEDILEPEAGPGQVKIRVGYNGICGTDLKLYYDGPFPGARPTSSTKEEPPLVLGHEFGGRVIEVGDGVVDVTPGMLVAIEPLVPCGECEPCRAGRSNVCRAGPPSHGVSKPGGGGLSDYTVVERRMVHPLPDELDARDAALVEPMAVSWHAVQRAGTDSGGPILILGAGPIGLGAFFALRWLGMDAIIVEPSGDRRAAVVSLGAPTVLDPAHEDVPSAVHDLTDGAGVVATLDTVGTSETFETGIASTMPGGSFVFVAAPPTDLDASLFPIFKREITLRGSFAYADDFPDVIDAMAQGAYSPQEWVSVVDLHDLERGIETLYEGSAMKVLVQLGGDV